MKNPWKKLPLKWRKEITSFLLTFAVAMGAAVLAWLDSDVPFTKATLWAILGTGLRSGAKAGLMLWIKR